MMYKEPLHVGCLPVAIPIGVQTERGVEEVAIDVSPWLEKWPDMTCSILHTRPGEFESYPVVTTMDGSVITWHVSDVDTAIQGVGIMEVVGMTPDEQHKKLTGASCSTVVEESTIDQGGEVPEAHRPWVDNILHAAGQVEGAVKKLPTISENGTWMMWNAETNTYEDTGKPSRGEQGPQGDPGPEGDQGHAATVKVGKVTTLKPGQQATVTNVGTDMAAVLDFGIPRGADGSGGSGGSGEAGADGEDGGYYKPAVQNGILTWQPSKADMPSVPGADIKGPAGEQGERGPAGVYMGPDEPSDPTVMVWVDPDGEADAPGSVVQFGPEDAGKLVYIGKDGTLIPLTLGYGLTIVDGVLRVTDSQVVRAVCGGFRADEAICGEV